MGSLISHNERVGVGKGQRLKKRFVPLLTLLLVIAITASLFVVFLRYPEKAKEFENYGYLGAFLISLISSATVILPVPGIVVLFALGTTLNPVLVALAGAAGGIFGEMTGFMAGYGGREVVGNGGRTHTRVESWMRRWGVWGIFLFAAVPLPVFDIAGVVAGALGYPLWKFLLVGWVGKSIKYVILVLAGAWGWEAVLRYFG